MRRKDREITDISEILNIIKKCDTIRLAFFDDEYPYIIPMNFGISCEEDKISFYFHSASEGTKLDLLKKCNKVGFELDCEHKLIKGEKACDYTMEFESVCGNGTISIVSDEEKKLALDFIMKQYENKDSFNYDEKYINLVTILKLSVDNITGKRLKRN